MIHGITVNLHQKTQTGVDVTGKPVYEENIVPVDTVLVAPAASTDVLDSTSLQGKRLVMTLGIPKGDTHDWLDCNVDFWGHTWKTFGFPTEGIESNIPLSWNKKVTVELYG